MLGSARLLLSEAPQGAVSGIPVGRGGQVGLWVLIQWLFVKLLLTLVICQIALAVNLKMKNNF